MNLIDSVKIENISVNFWYGLDLDRISKHPKNGSEGFMIILFDSFQQERLDYKISNIFENYEINFDDFFEKLDNNYLLLYQCGDYKEDLIETIKKNLYRQIVNLNNFRIIGKFK